jgi:hypothetical protein
MLLAHELNELHQQQDRSPGDRHQDQYHAVTDWDAFGAQRLQRLPLLYWFVALRRELTLTAPSVNRSIGGC